MREIIGYRMHMEKYESSRNRSSYYSDWDQALLDAYKKIGGFPTYYDREKDSTRLLPKFYDGTEFVTLDCGKRYVRIGFVRSSGQCFFSVEAPRLKNPRVYTAADVEAIVSMVLRYITVMRDAGYLREVSLRREGLG